MSIDALDQGKIRHFLSFDNDSTGLIEIVEPIGFDAANISLVQESDRYGRDVSFSGGENTFEFHALVESRGVTHEFDRLNAVRNIYGPEGDVKYILNYDSQNYIIGEIDFEASETDQIRIFKCKIIQDRLEATIARNIKTNVNLLSDTDIDGNPIAPVDIQKILVEATPLKTVSQWSQLSPLNVAFNQDRNAYFSLTPNIDQSEIENTLPPEYIEYENNVNGVQDFDAGDNYTFLEAVNTLTNVRLKLSDFTYDTNIADGEGNIELVYQIGENYVAANNQILSLPLSANDYSDELDLGVINRNERLWVFFHVFKSNATPSVSGNFSTAKIEITATDTALDSVTNMVRLIDAMKQVVLSCSGALVDAPEFEVGGPLYDQYIVLGNQLRNIEIEQFDLSLDDILSGIKEFDADYEVQPDGTVYFGTRDTFYGDERLDTFDIQPNNEFVKVFNPRYVVKNFNLKYDKYEKGQNSPIENSKEGIHGEAQFNMPNVRASNKKSISLPWARDPFFIEKIRRQGIKVSDSTSQENDENICILDVKQADGPISRIESFIANHVISNVTVLELINDGSFNWSVTGISVNDTITLVGENPGSYVVGSIGGANLHLIPVSPTPNPSFSGLTYSTISYNITSTNLVAATNQGFTSIVGSTDPSGFANMSFSIARNIRNFFGSYLKTVAQRHPNGKLINTLFRYNADFATKKDGEPAPIVEGADIEVSQLNDAILNQDTTNAEVICDFERFWRLKQNVREKRGYIGLRDNLGNIIKTYPQRLEFNWKDNKLTIKGEDRAI